MSDEEKLAAAIRRERIRRAREMSPAQKFRAGGDLFDTACAVTLGGIRYDFPHWTEEQVLEELRRRIARRRAREYRLLRSA